MLICIPTYIRNSYIFIHADIPCDVSQLLALDLAHKVSNHELISTKYQWLLLFKPRRFCVFIMTNLHDSVTLNFTHPVLPPLTERPTYQTIAALNLMLNANAASVHSNRGDGIHGLLILTVSAAVYQTTTGMNFVPPTNPGIHPTIPTNADAVQLAHATREHNARLQEWKQFIATDNALKQQLFNAIPDIYLATLRNPVTGFSRVTTRATLNHLYNVYGRITAHDYDANDKTMKKPYDPNEPFETFVKQIEDAMMLADAAAKPYTPAQVEQVGYMLLERTGVFNDECKLWRRRHSSTKTWTQMKIDFAEAHRDLVETKQTAGEAGYQNVANYIDPQEQDDFQRDTAAALANLASATEADRSTLKEMAAANSALTKQLASVTSSLNQALGELKQMRLTANNNPQGNQDTSRYRKVRKYQNNNYCWSCGFDISDNHTSATCKWTKEGHKSDATKENTMGGSQKRRHLVM